MNADNSAFIIICDLMFVLMPQK